LIIKIAIVGIVVFAVVTVALMPSPGNILYATPMLSRSDPASQAAAVNVTIFPEQVVAAVGQEFSVEVWVNNVTDMAGWQFELYWSKEIINCTKARVNTPPEWGGPGFDWFNKTVSDVDPNTVYTAWQFAPGIENNYDATRGRYSKAECYGPNGSPRRDPFNGSIAVVTLTFQALRAGSTSLSFSNVVIGDQNAEEIASIGHNGLVEVTTP
jgi:hypothetical protein